MKAELPELLQGFLTDAVLHSAVRLPKETLRRQAARKRGEKALIDAAILSAWTSTLRYDTCGIPPRGDNQYEELVVICAKLSSELKAAKISRLQELLHLAVPYRLLLILDDSKSVRVSALLSGDPIGQMVSVTLTASAKAFVGDLTVPQEKPDPHLMAVYHRWYCAIQAQSLHQSHPLPNLEIPYKRLNTPSISADVTSRLRIMAQSWKHATASLNRATNPQERIALNKQRVDAAQTIRSIISKL